MVGLGEIDALPLVDTVAVHGPEVVAGFDGVGELSPVAESVAVYLVLEVFVAGAMDLHGGLWFGARKKDDNGEECSVRCHFSCFFSTSPPGPLPRWEGVYKGFGVGGLGL